MEDDRCSLCGKNLMRASMVRCAQVRCPLARHETAASPKAIAGIVVTGLVFAAAIAVGISFVTDASGDSTAGTPQQSVAATVTARAKKVADISGSTGWIAKLFTSSSAAKAEADAAAARLPDLSLPDVRAATRVQSFSCAGSLSSSRSLICTRWDLATADYNVSLAYATALRRTRNAVALRRARADWLVELDRIGNDPDRILDHFVAFQKVIATT